METEKLQVVKPEDEKQAVSTIQEWAAFLIGLVPVVAAATNAFGKVVDKVCDFVDSRVNKEN